MIFLLSYITHGRELSGAGVENITIVKVHPQWLRFLGQGLASQGFRFRLRKKGMDVKERGTHVAQTVLVGVVAATAGILHHHQVIAYALLGMSLTVLRV